MASDLEYRQEARRQEAPFPPSQVMLQASGDELEHQNLSMLLKVFPGISLQSIAEAYTMAEGDPNYAAELLSFICQSSSEAQTVHDQEEGGKKPDFFEPKPLETVFHFEKSAEQLEEGEKQDAESVLCAGTPSVHNHSGRPPETKLWEVPEPASPGSSSLGISTALMGKNGANGMSKSPTRGNGGVTAAAAGNRARDGTGNGLPSNGNSLLPGWKGFSNGNKLSAVSGTVSSHRQRRNEYLSNGGGKDSRDCREGDEAFFYGKQRKKKGGGSNSQSNGNATDALKEQKAAEDFLHSMLGEGFELGIDVVGDVLDHFGGDINKAMETLLHMASTSAGFQNTELSDQGCDEDVEQTTNALLPKDLVLSENSCSDVVAEQPSLDRIVAKLHENFPTVELSFLSEVLQASECSYGSMRPERCNVTYKCEHSFAHTTSKETQQKMVTTRRNTSDRGWKTVVVSNLRSGKADIALDFRGWRIYNERKPTVFHVPLCIQQNLLCRPGLIPCTKNLSSKGRTEVVSRERLTQIRLTTQRRSDTLRSSVSPALGSY